LRELLKKKINILFGFLKLIIYNLYYFKLLMEEVNVYQQNLEELMVIREKILTKMNEILLLSNV